MKVLCVCVICGKEIGWYYPSVTRKTCSKECYKKHHSIISSGERNNNYKFGKYFIPNKCELCGTPIDQRSKRCIGCKKHGNRYNTKAGYVLVRNRKHPNRNHNNDVCEHIMVMADHLNRPIVKGEIVHHIDFIRNNNEINNLYLYPNLSQHGKCTRDIFKMVNKLLALKIIEFKNGEYFMKEFTERDGMLIRGESE